MVILFIGPAGSRPESLMEKVVEYEMTKPVEFPIVKKIIDVYKPVIETDKVPCSVVTPLELMEISLSGDDLGNILVVYDIVPLQERIKNCTGGTIKKTYSIFDEARASTILAKDEGIFENIYAIFEMCKQIYNLKTGKIMDIIEVNYGRSYRMRSDYGSKIWNTALDLKRRDT